MPQYVSKIACCSADQQSQFAPWIRVATHSVLSHCVQRLQPSPAAFQDEPNEDKKMGETRDVRQREGR
jgi:hypothetical protein